MKTKDKMQKVPCILFCMWIWICIRGRERKRGRFFS